MRKDSGYLALAAYYAEIIYIGSEFGELCRIILPHTPIM